MGGLQLPSTERNVVLHYRGMGGLQWLSYSRLFCLEYKHSSIVLDCV